MFTLYGGNNKTWWDMTNEERKICLVVVGIIVVGFACYGIYYYFKNRNKDKM